jgi:uncharacterized protein
VWPDQSVLTTSTLEQLSELRPQSRFDERRFRMNVIVATESTGFDENDWIGGELAIGDAVRLSVTTPDPRCVMTTHVQDELPKDTDVFRTLTRHNRVQLGAAGRFPCAGVYAVVEAPGAMRTGGPRGLHLNSRGDRSRPDSSLSYTVSRTVV